MRILIVETDYPRFLEQLYRDTPGLEQASYAEQLAARSKRFFGFGHAYARELGLRGHDARVVCANNPAAQGAWAVEHGGRRLRARIGADRLYAQPWLWYARAAHRRIRSRPVADWSAHVLEAQIRDFTPELVLCLDPVNVDARIFRNVRDAIGLLVAQHAATSLGDLARLTCYDLFLSSFPATVETVRGAGVRAERLRLGFDRTALAYLEGEARTYDVSFIGNLFKGIHDSRIRLLEEVCAQLDNLVVWTPDVRDLAPSSPIRLRHAGTAWGIDMLRVLVRSRITVNHHGDVPAFANNYRLFEATGCGALLVTDAKPDLGELFDVGREVVAYEDPQHCVATIRRYLEDEPGRAEIASAGRDRTLLEHTLDRRVDELLAHVSEVPPRVPRHRGSAGGRW